MSEPQREWPFRLRYPLRRDQRPAHLGGLVDPGTLLPMEREVLLALRAAGYDMSVSSVDTAVPVSVLYNAYLDHVLNDTEVERNKENCRTLNEKEFGVALNMVYAIPHTLHELMLAEFRGEVEAPGIRKIVTRRPKFRCRVRVGGKQVLAVPGMTGPGQVERRVPGRPKAGAKKTEAPPLTSPEPEVSLDVREIEKKIREARQQAFKQAMEIRNAEVRQRRQEREAERQQRERRTNLKNARPARIRLGPPKEKQ